MRLFRQQRSEVSKREATLTVKNPTLKRFIRVQFLVKFYFYEYLWIPTTLLTVLVLSGRGTLRIRFQKVWVRIPN